MRKLMWFSMGFGAACALGAYCYAFWLLWVCAAGLLISAGICLLRSKMPAWRQILAALLGVSLGLGWYCGYHHFYLQSAVDLDGSVISLTAVALDYSNETQYGSTVNAKITLSGKTYRTLLYLKEASQLKPGDEISGAFRLRMTHEGLEENTYHRGNGVFLLGYAQGNCSVTYSEGLSVWDYPAVLRKEILVRLDRLFPEDVSFFAKALLLGDRTGVDYETNTAFKTSGISHIIAVSGLHVSILFSVIYLLAGRRRVLTALLGIPVLLLFAAMAGFTPSITRACVMQILMIVAMLLNREYDPPTALSAAVLLMLLVNPVVITSASFQLSVGCMAGIFLFSGRIQSWIIGYGFWKDWKGKCLKVRLRQWFASGVSVTISAMFFTTPLVAYYFGAISLVGIVSNLLTLWVVTGIFYGILLVCLVSLFWYQGASIIAWIVGWLIRYVLTVAKALASLPLSAVYTKSGHIIIWLIFCYVLLGVFMLWKERKPSILISCCILGLCVSLFCSWIEPYCYTNSMTVLDVGQGQCILLQSQGRTYLVDCGGDQDTEAADLAAETLMSMGIFRLDGVILTHYDEDHAGGVGKLLSRVPSQMVLLPRGTEDNAIQQEILAASEGNSFYIEEDIKLSWDDSSLTVFAPISDTSSNESGLCVLFQGEKCDILITGDIGIEGEEQLLLQKKIPKLTALVAGHHGSKYSTGTALLSQASPQYVLISVGQDNTYGHPNFEVLERLKECGCEVYRTDLNGTIVFGR